MSLILLDAGPLSDLTHPRDTRSGPITEWARAMDSRGHSVLVPEIADYEVRRELIRSGWIRSIVRLNRVTAQLDLVPITTLIMLRAADLWALSRRAGRPSASDDALDADMILAATALTVAAHPDVVIATTNAKHLAPFCDARHWREIG